MTVEEEYVIDPNQIMTSEVIDPNRVMTGEVDDRAAYEYDHALLEGSNSDLVYVVVSL
jgi:hypothetical protein